MVIRAANQLAVKALPSDPLCAGIGRLYTVTPPTAGRHAIASVTTLTARGSSHPTLPRLPARGLFVAGAGRGRAPTPAITRTNKLMHITFVRRCSFFSM